MNHEEEILTAALQYHEELNGEEFTNQVVGKVNFRLKVKPIFLFVSVILAALLSMSVFNFELNFNLNDKQVLWFMSGSLSLVLSTGLWLVRESA